MVTISSSYKRTGQKEAEIQKDCFWWLASIPAGDDTLASFTYMVPNGTQLGGSHRQRAVYMSSLKAQGFRSGVSDLVIAYPVRFPNSFNQCWHGAYIELKKEPSAYGGPKATAARKNAIRLEQRDWLKRMSSVGYFASVAWGLEDFKRLVGLFLAGEKPPPLDWDERVCDTDDAQ